MNKEFEVINTKFMARIEDVASMDSIMYEIDNGREYQLEQPTALTSAKNYKEKIVDSLIKKLKQLVRTVYGKYAEIIKVVEEIRRMHKQQREMNKYYEEWRKGK